MLFDQTFNVEDYFYARNHLPRKISNQVSQQPWDVFNTRVRPEQTVYKVPESKPSISILGIEKYFR